MSWHINSSVLVQSDGNKTWWTTVYDPGDDVPVSGIYRCLGCKREITSNKDDPFPPQNHHQHQAGQGAIRWKLNVRTNTNGD
ncbi:protein L [Pseudoxanthomonas winnipegensis]|uniref:Protein L n=1 Tax=Pseudoxanthomonas winnipegensis TaxID=2480810 RepID=A0A4Q8M825_9GAMM|nr:protein L [Pseudoxanthomonas winnipegensis]